MAPPAASLNVPPWTRPGWLQFSKSQRRYAVAQYNAARTRRNMEPVAYNPDNVFPDNFSAANINSNHPKLGRTYKQELNRYMREQGAGLNQQNIEYFRTTTGNPEGNEEVMDIDEILPEDQLEQEAAAFERGSEAEQMINQFDINLLPSGSSGGQANKRPEPSDTSTEKQGGKRQKKLNNVPGTEAPAPATPAPVVSSPPTAPTPPTTTTTTGAPQAPTPPEAPTRPPRVQDEAMTLTGTGGNGTSQSEGGGESGPSKVPSNVSNGTRQTYTYKKTYKIKLIGNAPSVINEAYPNTTFTTKLLATNLREIPVQYLGAYVTPAEYTFLSNKKGVRAISCHVTVAKKATAAAFATNASTTQTAVLNYNKTYKHATGLNQQPFFTSKSIAAYSATQTGMPTQLSPPVNWNTICSQAWTQATVNNIPAGITFTSITAPNIYVQQVATDSGLGWYDHSSLVHTFDDGASPFVDYRYDFQVAPLTPDYDNYFQIYPNRTSDDNNINISIYDRGQTSNRKRTYEGSAYSLHTHIEQAIARDYPMDLMTGFNINQVIEKSNLIGREASTPHKLQPSLHVGIGEVAAHGVFSTLNTAAQCFPTKFVEIFGEVWVTMSLTVAWYEPAPLTVSQTGPLIRSENVMFTTDKNCPLVTNQTSRYLRLPFEVDTDPASNTYGQGIAVPTAPGVRRERDVDAGDKHAEEPANKKNKSDK